MGKALIADRRSDENLILSQLHLALMLLHNKAVSALEPQFPDPARLLRSRRVGLLTRHYHWLILHDYLPRLLSRSVLATPLVAAAGADDGRSLACPWNSPRPPSVSGIRWWVRPMISTRTSG